MAAVKRPAKKPLRAAGYFQRNVPNLPGQACTRRHAAAAHPTRAVEGGPFPAPGPEAPPARQPQPPGRQPQPPGPATQLEAMEVFEEKNKELRSENFAANKIIHDLYEDFNTLCTNLKLLKYSNAMSRFEVL